MSILSKIRDASIFARKGMGSTRQDALGAAFQLAWSAYFRPGQPVYTEMTVEKAVRDGYKMAIPVYRAIRAIIQAGSSVPWVVQDKDGLVIPGHPFISTWDRPNPHFSGQDNMEYLIAHLVLCGNAYLRPLYVGKTPREFWIEMPDGIQPVPGKNLDNWLEGYLYKNTVVPPETFLHFRQADPANLYVGVGAIQAAGRAIDTYNEAMDTQKVSMQNRGLHSGILSPEAPEGLDEKQYQQAWEKFSNWYLDKNARRKPWFFPKAMKWQNTDQTPVEMDYINSQKELIRQIAAAIGVDPWWVGDRSSSTYNNVKEARKALYEDVALPLLDDIQAELNLKIAPLYGGDIYITYDTSNIPALREDNTSKYEQAVKLYGMGIPLSQINDKLELGFDEFPGWDIPRLPMNLVAVDKTGLPDPNTDPEDEPDIEPDGKTVDPTEEIKIREWKRIDTRREGWVPIVTKRLEALYAEMGRAIAKAVPYGVDEAIEATRSQWEKTLTSIYVAVAGDFGEQAISTAKSAKAFDPMNSWWVRAWLTHNTAGKVTTILDTQKELMAEILRQGIADSTPVRELARQIKDFYTEKGRYFAERVARTETAAAASAGQIGAASEGGMTHKVWLSVRDHRTRDTHEAMDGETVGITKQFSNGCDAPGIGDDPAEVINCRCVLSFSC